MHDILGQHFRLVVFVVAPLISHNRSMIGAHGPGLVPENRASR